MFSIQEQCPHSRHNRLKSRFVLSIFTILVVVIGLPAAVKADAVTRWNEIATTTFTADPTINFNPLAEDLINKNKNSALAHYAVLKTLDTKLANELFHAIHKDKIVSLISK